MTRRATRSKDREITIVKRRGKRDSQAEQQGGAWKVAFADFTLAMMALFMVLWIVQPLPGDKVPPRGEQDSNPLVDGGAGVFEGVSRTPLELEGVQLPVRRDVFGRKDEEAEGSRRYSSAVELRELAELMRKVAWEIDALANIEIEVVPQGLRILIKDDEQRFMFERSSATLNPHFESLLGRLGRVLAKVENKLIISGHTDATLYRRDAGYDNWNLSGDRALRARSVLVEAGLPARSVLQVAAQADVMPLRPEEPTHGANRRVEILLLTETAENLYKELFGDAYARVHYSAAGAELVPAEDKVRPAN